MASPFRVFRKHQKILIAVLGVLAMVAFVFLPIILQGMGSTSSRDPVVVKTAHYGNIRQHELGMMRLRRQRVLNFFERVGGVLLRDAQQAFLDADAREREAKALESGGASADQVAEARQEADKFRQEAEISGRLARALRTLESQIGPTTEESLVDNWLCVQKARQLGLVVSDRAINEFIREMTDNRIRSRQLETILRNIGLRQAQFFEILRDELLALRLRQMFTVSLFGMTPAQRFDYYTRLNRKATIEVIAVPVADHLDKIDPKKLPNEEQLRAFFEEHKTDYPDPGSPEPGFLEPHRIAVRYFKADYDRLMSPDYVTDQEVLERYEDQKELYDRLLDSATGQPAEDEKTTDQPAEDQKTEVEAPEDKPPDAADDQSTTPPTQDTPPAETEPPREETETAPAETEEVEPSQPQQEPTEGPPSAAGEKGGGPGPEPSDSGDASSAPSASPFLLASLTQEQDAPAESDQPDQPPSESETPAGPPQEPTPEPGKPPAETQASPAETKPPAEEPEEPEPSTPETEPPAEEPKEPDTSPPEPESPAEGVQQPDTAPPATATVKKERTPEEILASTVGKAIRRELARQKIQGDFDRIRELVQQYRKQWVVYDAIKGENEDAQAPKPLDLAGLAREYNLTAGRAPTKGLMSQFDALESDLGRSQVDGGRSFRAFAFEVNWPPYVTETSLDADGNMYLFWKVADAKERIPDFKEQGVRQRVLRRWKMIEARGLAKQAAEKLAAEAREKKQSLEKAFAGRPDVEVTRTDPFSWMTRGDLPPLASPRAPARRSQLPGVEIPGPDFMRTAFRLDEGQIGVTMNNPQTVAYVIRVVEFDKSADVLWAGFQSDYFGTYADIAQGDQAEMGRAWWEALRAAAGLKWVRSPERRSGE